jgi:predicted glutamine amidotransferase
MEKTLCRWLAYSGSPILLEELLYKPEHSLIDQSLHARLGVETTNGDGFGVGWYGANTETPAVFHSIESAWNEVPESSYGVVQEGEDDLHPIQPRF